MRIVRLALACVSLLLGTPASATIDPAGHWILRAEGRVLTTLELKRGKDGTWKGTLSRPSSINSFRGSFYNISGPVTRLRISGTLIGQDKIELGIANGPSDSGAPRFLFEFVDQSHAAFQLVGAGVEKWMLTRTAGPEEVSQTWVSSEMYAADANWPSNPEMKRIFDQDQAARKNLATIDWAIVSRDDDVRRRRTKQLLDGGKLRSGDDYYHAAYIFQHGGKAEDYLMAHTLAIIANARGSSNATWIAAATLDRYLQTIGQPQIYGTQYRGNSGGGSTQEPYDKKLLSDELRAELGVPPLAEQEQRRKTMGAKPKP